MDLLIKRLDDGMALPAYAHQADAGLDLCSADDARIKPGQRHVVGTGLAVAIPDGYVGLVAPRSGLALSVGLSAVNTPGVVDAGYRGEVKLILINHDTEEAIVIERGQRVAQLLIVPVVRVVPVEVDDLPGSERGQGGFGSSGT